MEIGIKLNSSLCKFNLDQTEQPYLDQIESLVENQLNIDRKNFVIISTSGVKLTAKSNVHNGDTFQLCPLVLGGKGGFGSLLRAFGKQITMSTNKDACRDLTGRRIKQVNAEKNLKDFAERQNELAKQRELKKKEKAKRRKNKLDQLENGKHLFVDQKYDEQKQKIANDLEEAISKAMKEKAKSDSDEPNTDGDSNQPKCSKSSSEETSTTVEPTTSNNVKHDLEPGEITATSSKLVIAESKKEPKKVKHNQIDSKLKDWMGVGDLDVSSSSDEDEVPLKSKRQFYSYNFLINVREIIFFLNKYFKKRGKFDQHLLNEFV